MEKKLWVNSTHPTELIIARPYDPMMGYDMSKTFLLGRHVATNVTVEYHGRDLDTEPELAKIIKKSKNNYAVIPYTLTGKNIIFCDGELSYSWYSEWSNHQLTITCNKCKCDHSYTDVCYHDFYLSWMIMTLQPKLEKIGKLLPPELKRFKTKQKYFFSKYFNDLNIKQTQLACAPVFVATRIEPECSDENAFLISLLLMKELEEKFQDNTDIILEKSTNQLKSTSAFLHY